MDTLKACINPESCGFLTAGETRTLELTLEKTDVAVDLAGATFQTMVPAFFGGTVVLADADHSIIGPSTDGRVDLVLSAANSAKLKRGLKVQFMVVVTIGGDASTYWGTLDEVREPIK